MLSGNGLSEGHDLSNIQTADGKPVNGAKPGETRALTHGFTSVVTIAPKAEGIAATLRPLIPAYTTSDEPALTLLAWQLARIESANEYLAEHGLLDAKGKPRPVLKILSTSENSAARLMDALGLTPTSRAKLGVDLAKGADLAAELAKAQATGDRARARMEGGEV